MVQPFRNTILLKIGLWKKSAERNFCKFGPSLVATWILDYNNSIIAIFNWVLQITSSMVFQASKFFVNFIEFLFSSSDEIVYTPSGPITGRKLIAANGQVVRYLFFPFLGFLYFFRWKRFVESWPQKSYTVKSKFPVLFSATHNLDSTFQVTTFQGLPYAEPPLGALRFQVPFQNYKYLVSSEFFVTEMPILQYPVELKRWADAAQNASLPDKIVCMQNDLLLIIGVEDCLRLDIFIPSVRHSQILIFILLLLHLYLTVFAYLHTCQLKSRHGPVMSIHLSVRPFACSSLCPTWDS